MKTTVKQDLRDRALVLATFQAISAAMGWDKEYPYELFEAAKLRTSCTDLVALADVDSKLRNKLNPEE